MKKFTQPIYLALFAALLLSQIAVYGQVPGNDLICNATTLSVGVGCTEGTNVNATATGSPAAPACWNPATTSNDVWYSFTATTENMTVSTDFSGLTLTNTQVAVYSSSDNTCNGTLTLVGCGENGGTNVADNSITNMDLIPGNTYFIRIDGNGTQTGTFCVSVAQTYTAGSTPCQAQFVDPNSSACSNLNGNIANNSTNPATSYHLLGINYPGCTNEANQVGTWTTFTANTTSVTLTNQSGGARYYTFFSGTCSNLNWISCTAVASAGTTMFTGLTAGSSYFLLTTLQNGDTTTNVNTDLCIQNTAACAAPSNDNCANAMAVTANVLYTVSNHCATPDFPPQLCSGTIQNNIWFTWTCPANWTGAAFFQLFNENCSDGNTSQGMQVSIYSPGVTCGGTANCVAVANSVTTNNVNFDWTPVPGSTYLMNFDGYSGENCTMNFEITNTVSVVVITVNSPTICQGDSAVLTAVSTATGYLWSNGDTTRSITVSPSSTTSYIVSATAGGTGSAVSTVTVNPIPHSPTGGSNSPVCAGSTLDLTASSITNASYYWAGPNGFTSGLQNPTIPNVTLAAAGTYIVWDSVLHCPSPQDTITVVINPTPPTPVAGSNSPVCSGDTLYLTATDTVSNSIYSYSWTGPNGFTSTLQNPSLPNATTAASGTYTVTAFLGNCASAPATTTVTINPVPAAPVAGSNSPICESTTLNLTAGNIAGATFSWTGPNGFTSTLQNPSINTVVLADSGLYSVVATISGCVSDTGTTYVVINATPATPVASSNSPVCQDSTLSLTVDTVAGGTYSWIGPNGFTSTLANPSIPNATSAASGTYSVVTTVSGCSSSVGTTDVIVNTAPVPVATSNSPICAGSTLNLNTSTIQNATYSWSGPNGFTSTDQNPSIPNATVQDSGTYSVTVSSNGCVSSTPATVSVVIYATSPPVAGSNSPVCSGATVFLTATTVTGATYSWTGPNGFTSTLQNPAITGATTAASGTYSVVANVSGCNSSTPATTIVVVNPIPTITAGNNSPLCVGNTLELTASTFAGATYSWTGPNGFTSNLQNPSITNVTSADTGTYSVTSSATGCSSSAPATTYVVINGIPVTPTTGSNSPLCVGDTLNLTINTIGGATYNWAGPNGFTSTLQDPSVPGVTLAAAGVYSVTATVAGCASAPGHANVVIHPIPVTPTVGSNSPVCAGDTINLTSTTVSGATFSWTGPAGFTSTLQDPSIDGVTVNNSGTYSVIETVAGCNSAAASTVVVVNPLPPAPIAGSNSPVCIGDTLFLTASFIPGATYLWTDLIGFTSTDENPIVPNVTALAGSTYTVVATVNGCTGPSAQVTVIVTPRPVASFTSTAPACSGTPVNFTNTGSTGAGFTFFWNFGPGATPATSTNENPTGVVYSAGGTITVTLTIGNGSCSTTDTQTIQITGQPQAYFVNDGPACFPPGIVTFTDSSSGNITSWNWDFGTGATPPTSTSQGPIAVTYSAPGTISVMLTVSGGGCSSTTTETVDVGVVGADFTSSVPMNGSDGCLGQPVNFYNIGSSGTGAQYYWNFGADAIPATSTDENPVGIIYTATGAKIVTHIVYATNCNTSDTITHIITINPTPNNSFTSNAPVCANVPVNFTNTGDSGVNYSYFWDFGSGASPSNSIAEDPAGVNYSTSGVKTVTFSITNEFYCVVQTTQNITINSTPTATFSSNSPQCTLLPVDFTNTGTASGVSWLWNFGPNANPITANTENPSGVTYAVPGLQTVTLVTTDNTSGCVDSVSNYVTINLSPYASFTTNAPQCSTAGFNFTNTGSTGGTWSYTWNFGVGASPPISSAENPSGVVYSSGGTKTVTFTVTGPSGCTQTNTQTIVVDSTPTASFTSTAPQCTGVGVDFTNTGTATGVTYAWDLGAGATPPTSTDQNPTGVTYSSSGTKTISLVVTNGVTGCSASATSTININQTPVASFTSNAPQCTNTAINFTNTGSTGGSWSYAWDFGTGANPSSSSSENPGGILYSSGGSKTVSLTVSGGGCTQVSTQTIVISSTPVASFITNAPQCTGTPINFTNTGTSTGVSWSWNFGSGSVPDTSTLQNPTGIIYSASGLTGTTLTITDTTSGCTATASQTYNIPQTPTATFTTNAPQCSTVPINFTNTGSTGGSWTYSWDLGAGAEPAFSSSQNPTGVIYTSSGTKTITFTVADQYCSQTIVQTIVISSTPAASFTSTAPECTGLGVGFSNTGTVSGVSYAWNFGTGATPATDTVQNPSGVVYSTAGTITVTLTTTDTSSGCSVTVSNNIVIHQTPTASFTSTAPQCSTVPINFTNTGSTGGNWSYNWDFGQGANPALSASQNPSGISYSSSGTKTVTFTISDQNCTQSATQNIVINSTPAASFNSTAPQCTGLPVNFGNTGTTAGVTWLWNFGPGATPTTDTAQNPNGVVYSTAGTQTVTLTTTDTGSGCSVTASNVIQIHQTPTASFTSNAPQCGTVPINFTNTGSTGGNWYYSWNLGQNAVPAVSAAENPSGVLYSSSGSKVVTFTISDQNCTQTTVDTIVINSTPAASFNSTAPQCTGLPVNFDNTGTATGVNWLWNFGPAATPITSTDQNPTGVIYSTAGTQTVTLTTTDSGSGCAVTATGAIVIHQTPTASFTSTAPVCTGINVNFTNTGSTGGNWTYAWDFGLGSSPPTSSGENPSGIFYSSSGTKTVTFTISDQNCTQTTTDSIVILETPVSNFASTAPQCTGLPVNFTNEGTSTGVTWAWNFGTGASPATDITQNPQGVTYSTAGIISVSLTVTDNTSACAVTTTNNITIYQTPTATFTSNAPQCTNTPINFNNTGSTGSNWTYAWDFGQNATPGVSSAQNPSGVLYNASGAKTITFTISDANCAQSISDTIMIDTTPVASFTSTAPECSGLPVNFTNTGTSAGVTWSWNFGSGAAPSTSVSQNPAGVVYSTYGIMAVTLTITDASSSCSATATNTINIYQTPSATFLSNAPQCANSPINFTNTGTNGANWSYSWDLGANANPAVSTSQNPSGVLYDSSGTKTVTFTISDAHCSQTATEPVVINALPFAQAGLDTTVCANQSVRLGGDSITPGATYSWFPSTTLDNPFVPNPIASPTASITTYSVTVTAAGTGCTNSDYVIVTMLNPLIANAGTDAQICVNDSVGIGAGLIEGQFYQWTPATGLSSVTAPNPIASPTQTTTYTVVVTDTAGCAPISDMVTVTVNPLPNASAGPSDTIQKGGSVQLTGTGGVQYFWTPSTGLSNANLFNPIASPDTTTTYVLTVTNLFGCQNTDTTEVFVFDVAAPYWIPSAFTPNGDGHNDMLYVRGGGFVTFEFSVYDRYGELIFDTKDITEGWDGKNLAGQPAPMDAYVYRINGALSDGTNVNSKGLVNLVR